MQQRKTEAVILDTTDVFDADRSYLLFSKELGKIRARAKGVRKPTSRLTGHLLPFLPIQMELILSGGWYLVVQAHLLNKYASDSSYPDNPLTFLKFAAIVSESVNRLFIEADPHPAIYEGLVYTLDRLRSVAHQSQTAELVVAEFLLKALSELGYRAELQKCVVTGEEIKPDFIAWSSGLGGVLSKEGYGQAEGDAWVLRSPKTIIGLRQLLEPDFRAERLQMEPEIQAEMSQVVYHFVQSTLGQPLKSLLVLRD